MWGHLKHSWHKGFWFVKAYVHSWSDVSTRESESPRDVSDYEFMRLGRVLEARFHWMKTGPHLVEPDRSPGHKLLCSRITQPAENAYQGWNTQVDANRGTRQTIARSKPTNVSPDE